MKKVNFTKLYFIEKYIKLFIAAVAVTFFISSIHNIMANEVLENTVGTELITTTQPQTTKLEQSTLGKSEEKATTEEKVTVRTPKIKKGYVKNKASLIWKKSNKKDGYEIWVSAKKKGKYHKISTTKGKSFKLKNLVSGKLYYVKVRAYRTVNNKVYKSSFSSQPTQVLTNVKLKRIRSPFAGMVTVDWENGISISGYSIQYSMDKNFKKAKTVTVKGKTNNSVNLYDLEQNKKYYVRIRTYKTVGKKKIYSLWSEDKNVKVSGTAEILNGGFMNTKGYFKNSVFFGDSVLQGYQIYMNSKGKEYLDNAKVMGVISYSLIAALQDESKYHPLYKGKHVAPQYVTKALGADKVFLFFGINDIENTGNVEHTFNNYKELIRRIKNVNPGVKVHIISTTYPMKGSKDYVNYSKKIHKLNEKMRKYCDETDCEYIDIASYLSTSDGYLRSDLCSDNFVHQKISAYEIWDKVLRAYARSYKK